MISVVDYGVANVGSLMNMHRRCGIPARRVTSPDDVLESERLILPGVGSFDNGMAHLRRGGLADAVLTAVRERGVPILGICLGMQLLGMGSEEGTSEGLGLMDARCIRFSFAPGSATKVPHQGWSQPILRNPTILLTQVTPNTRFYFSHSYHMVCSDPGDVAAVASYGIHFTAMVQRGNIHGVQFHPEKSHRYGMELLRSYAAAT
jgi:glutamine amidotransferase